MQSLHFLRVVELSVLSCKQLIYADPVLPRTYCNAAVLIYRPLPSITCLEVWFE